MRAGRTVGILMLASILVGMCLPASADVTVTVQISGTIEEILPVLQLLQQSGFDKAAAESLEGLKLEINSTAAEGAPVAPPVAETVPAPATPPPPPQPALGAPAVQPAVAKPGDTVLISVQVTNVEGRIDTLAARSDAAGTYVFDLYDNGTQGDAVAGDGIWSYQYAVDANAPDGTIGFEIIAYDANAEPVKIKNEAGEEVPLTTSAAITVQKPQP